MKFFITNLFMFVAVLAFSQSPFSGQTYSVSIEAEDGNGNKQVIKQVTEVDSYDELNKMFTGSSIVKDFASDIMADVKKNYKDGEPYAYSTSQNGKSIEVTIDEGSTQWTERKRPGKRKVIVNRNGDTDVYEVEDDIIIELEDGESRRIHRPRAQLGRRGIGPIIAGQNDRDVPFMGVGVGPFNYKEAGNNHPKGVQVMSVVEGEAAFNAGIEEGDVITAIGDTKTPSPSLFTRAIKELEPGQDIQVTFYRDGKKMTETTTIGVREGNMFFFENGNGVNLFENLDYPEMNFSENIFKMGEDRPMLGVSIEQSEEGVAVLNVEEESAADEMGLKEGDIITEFAGEKITSVEELIEGVQEKTIGDEVEVRVLREGKKVKKKGKLKAGKAMNFQFFGDGQNFQFPGQMNQFRFDGQNLDELEGLLDDETIQDLRDRIKELEQELKEKKKKNNEKSSFQSS